LPLLSQNGTCQAELLQTEEERTRYDHNQADNNNNSNRDRENYDLQDVVFAATSKMRVSRKISGFVTVELVDIIATLLRACSILK
jgi:hypothetical protein